MKCQKLIAGLFLGSLATVAYAANILALDNPALISEEDNAYARGTSFIGSDFSPIRQIDSRRLDDYSPRDGANLVIGSARVQAGVEWKGFRIGTLYRQEWLAEANRDTLDIYRDGQLSLSYPVGRNSTIAYKQHGFEARGIELGKAFHLVEGQWKVALGVNASLLQGTTMRSETWSGSAVATSTNTLAITGEFIRLFTDMNTVANGFIPAYQNGNSGGSGYSVDLGLSLESGQGVRFEWTAGDVLSRMRWTSVPEITLSGSSVYEGTFPGGRKWRVDISENLPIKNALLLSIPVHEVRVELSDSTIRGYQFPVLGVRKELVSGWDARLDYEFRFRTVGFDIKRHIFFFGIRSDSLNLARARAFGLQAGIKIGF
jgi:hypothetical protein